MINFYDKQDASCTLKTIINSEMQLHIFSDNCVVYNFITQISQYKQIQANLTCLFILLSSSVFLILICLMGEGVQPVL